MRKHKYNPELVYKILADKEYVLMLFAYIFIKKHDILFLPKLRKNGDYTMKCPLHNERTPSLRFSPAKGIFKCFGCGNGGTILNLYAKYFDCSYAEAIKYALSFKKNPSETVPRLPVSKLAQLTALLPFPLSPSGGPDDDDDLPF